MKNSGMFVGSESDLNSDKINNFPKRYKKEIKSETKISLLSLILSAIYITFFFYSNLKKWDFNMIFLLKPIQIYRFFTSVFLTDNLLYLAFTLLIVLVYIGYYVEPINGSVKTIWKLFLMNCTLNICNTLLIYYKNQLFFFFSKFCIN